MMDEQSKELMSGLLSPEREFLNLENWIRVHYPNILNEYENTKMTTTLIYE